MGEPQEYIRQVEIESLGHFENIYNYFFPGSEIAWQAPGFRAVWLSGVL